MPSARTSVTSHGYAAKHFQSPTVAHRNYHSRHAVTNGGRSTVHGRQVKAINPPIERVMQAVKPTDVQRTALDALNDASKKAADFLAANCPVDQTLTPPARVAAMEKRLNAMIEAIKIVQPALQSFYGSLTDEQKAHFNQLGAAQG
jgi:hypothetical protein